MPISGVDTKKITDIDSARRVIEQIVERGIEKPNISEVSTGVSKLEFSGTYSQTEIEALQAKVVSLETALNSIIKAIRGL